MPTIDTNDLWQRAVARSAEIGANLHDLAPALALQQRMLQLVLDALRRLDQVDFPDQPDATVLEKWRLGLPALRNVIVPIPQFLKDLLPELCNTLVEGGAGESAQHIRDALVRGDIDAGSLLSVSLARNQKAIRTSALHMGLSPDLVWLVGELGSSALAHRLQSRLLAVRDWDRGYCPCCGSWPVFIELLDGLRVLRCSFCAAPWELQSHRCIYCGNAGDDFVAAAPDANRKNRRVELCRACGGYTKAIEVSELTPFPLLAIEDLASMDLDVGAMSREYHRPQLYDLESKI